MRHKLCRMFALRQSCQSCQRSSAHPHPFIIMATLYDLHHSHTQGVPLHLPVLTTCVLASSKAPTGGSFTAAFHNLPLRSAPGGHLERTNVLIWPSHYIQITAKQPLICNVYDYDWPHRPAPASPVAAASAQSASISAYCFDFCLLWRPTFTPL